MYVCDIYTLILIFFLFSRQKMKVGGITERMRYASIEKKKQIEDNPHEKKRKDGVEQGESVTSGIQHPFIHTHTDQREWEEEREKKRTWLNMYNVYRFSFTLMLSAIKTKERNESKRERDCS